MEKLPKVEIGKDEEITRELVNESIENLKEEVVKHKELLSFKQIEKWYEGRVKLDKAYDSITHLVVIKMHITK